MELLKYFLTEAPQKAQFILLMSAVAGMSEVASVLLTINGAQDVAAGRNYMLYAVFLPMTAAVFLFSKRISQTRAAALTESVLEKLYADIANDIRHAELPEIESRDTAEIHLKMLNAQTVTDAAVKGIHAFQSLIAISFLWLYIFWISHIGGLFSLLILALAVAVYEVTQGLALPLMQQEAEKERELADLLGHILYGAKEIRISRRKNDDLFANRLCPVIAGIKGTRCRIRSYFTGYSAFVTVCFFIMLGAAAFYFPVLHSHETVLSVILIVFYVWSPLVTIVSTLPGITEGKAAMNELRRLVQKESNRESGQPIYEPSEERTHKFTELRLDNVGFVYKSTTGEAGFPMGPVSFTGRTGEIIFVAGGNGSGKTTLMKILTGLYPLSSGEIEIDGGPVEMSRNRHLFSTVFSDFHLFAAIYGTDEIDNETVHKLLMQTELSHKTRWIAHERRFSTTRLSAGQRRRLALVVSLLEDKPVYVFDEWAADQDPHFRRYFYEILLPSIRDQGKLIIAVSHDDRYFHIADKLIKMEYGQMLSCVVPGDEPGSQKQVVEKSVTGHRNSPEEAEYQARPRKLPSRLAYGQKRSEKKKNRITELLQPSTRNGTFLLIFYGILAVICPLILVAVIFTAVNLPYGESVIRLFFLFVIALVLNFISFRQFSDSLTYLIEDRIAEIRLKVTEHIRHTDLYSFEKTGVETILTALTYDMKSVSEISDAMIYCIRAFFCFAGFLFYLATLSLTAFIMTVAVLGIGGIIFTYNQIIIRQAVYQVREGEKKLSAALTDIFNGFKELRLNSRKSDEFFHKCFISRGSLLRKLKLRAAARFIDIYMLVYGMWQVLFIICVLILPFAGFFSGNMLLTFVGVIVFLPVGTFAVQFPRITLSSISMQRLYDLGEELEHPENELTESAAEMETEESEFQEIRYEKISFQYEEDSEHPFSVGPLSMTFRSGEIVFIAGGNGSGKSTLLNLLTGLYPPRSGSVFLNGQETEPPRCRSLFSAIFYDFHLFDRLYGLENIDADRVNNLLGLMQLGDKVQFDGDRFSTLDLSTGQRKRLAMAAAMMEDKPIYIFDEWAADQDPHFRKYFYESLLPSFKAEGKTVIAVSHDDRYFHAADRIIRLDYGRVAES